MNSTLLFLNILSSLHRKGRWTISVLLCLYSTSGFTQDIFQFEGLVFERFSRESGLSHNRIHDILEDSQGFLWIATTNGLNVFDGTSMKVYKDYLNEGNTFKGRHVTAVLESNNGNILVGTKDNGINIFYRDTNEIVNVSDAFWEDGKPKWINSLDQLGEDQYALTTNKELITFHFNEKGFVSNVKHLLLDLGVKEYIRKSIKFNEHIYIATNQRLIGLEEGKQQTIFTHNFLNECKVINNRIWVLVSDRIGYFDSGMSTVSWIDFEIKESFKYYHSFDITSTNDIWLGAESGITRLKFDENMEVTTFIQVESIVPIFNVYCDSSNNIFLSVGGKQGLVKLDWKQHQYQYINLPKGYEEEYKNVFIEDKKGVYWIGGYKGVFAYNPNLKSFIKFNNNYKGLQDIFISGIVEDKKGGIWIGTSRGLAQYDNLKNDFNYFETDKVLENKFVTHLQLDQNNNLWFRTKNKLHRLNTQSKEINSYEFKDLWAIYIDEENLLWAIIGYENIAKINILGSEPKVVKTYSNELGVFETRSAISDSLGRIWFSGRNGIYVFDKAEEKIIKHINEDNLLTEDDLQLITPDSRGNFWIKQQHGVTLCINAKNFEIVDYAPKWMRLMNDDRQYAAPVYYDDSGKVFTDGYGGFFVYHSDSLKIDPTPPKIVLTDVQINGNTKFSNFLGLDNITLPNLKYSENAINLNLKIIKTEQSYQTNYAFRLLGNSEDWQFTKDIKQINFNTLSPNTYKFQIKTTNNGIDWSLPTTLATFEILPPLWKTIWAYFIYGFILFWLVYFIYKVQLKRKLAISEANKLKEVDDFKNTFYNNITHEFRTPLTVILGMTEKLEKSTASIIRRNANHLLNLVNELLELGKIESNKSRLDIKTQDVVKFAKYCLESFHSLAQEKGIELSFASNSESIMMNFDEDKLQLVFYNLLSNAIKFTPNSGKVEMNISKENRAVSITVNDNGIGIPENLINKVFNRYYQVKTNDGNAGSGIGLALTKELVNLMDGSITASNNPDEGVSFIIKFPITEINTEIQYPRNISNEIELVTSENNKNLVLIIEDNEDVMMYVKSILEDSFDIVTAVNGKIGLEKAIEIIPDLIISDIMMPIMDGYEVCHEIKSDFRTNHIPLILLTAKSDLNSKISGLKKGADVYLSKPFNREELLTHISNLIKIRENLKEKYSQLLQDFDAASSGLNDSFLERIRGVLIENINDESFGINEVCSAIGLSRTQLHRKLKALTGLSTSIFIREIRLQQAFELLIKSQLSISEIAYAVGFSDPNYFTKVFHDKYKKTPTSIREKT